MKTSVQCTQLYCACVQYLCRGQWFISWPWRFPMALIRRARTDEGFYDDFWLARTRRERSKVRPSRVKSFDPRCSGIQTHIAYIFCTVAVVNLSRSIWYLFWCSFVYPVYDFRVINFRFPWHTKWELLGGEYIWVDLNRPPEFYNALNWIANQIFYLCSAKCAYDTAIWRRKKNYSLRNWWTTAHSIARDRSVIREFIKLMAWVTLHSTHKLCDTDFFHPR